MFLDSRTPPISDQTSALPGRRLQSAPEDPEDPEDPADQEARRALWDRCRPASFGNLLATVGTWAWRLVGQELEVVVEEEEVAVAALAWVERHRIGPLAKYSADRKGMFHTIPFHEQRTYLSLTPAHPPHDLDQSAPLHVA